ncbi:hypothetical protein NQZ68_000905 [Dissostichus eleginoides]|nr:hypothetical protein NQZ68_000905 [Dissostichus eleginoides]
MMVLKGGLESRNRIQTQVPAESRWVDVRSKLPEDPPKLPWTRFTELQFLPVCRTQLDHHMLTVTQCSMGYDLLFYFSSALLPLAKVSPCPKPMGGHNVSQQLRPLDEPVEIPEAPLLASQGSWVTRLSSRPLTPAGQCAGRNVGDVYFAETDGVQWLLAGSSSTGNSWKVSCPPRPPPPLPSKEPIKQCCNANSKSKESEGQVSGAEGMSV